MREAPDVSAAAKIALCVPGGGATGAMYQIGALAAFDDCVAGFSERGFDLYVGAGSGATVAAVLAAGRPPERIYRAFLDPSDTYFPLERRHLLHMDFPEWRRTVVSIWQTLRHGSTSLLSRGPTPTPSVLWEELDRLFDTLPAGFFALDRYERFLEEFFVRRAVANSFPLSPRPLRILAHDLDSGEPALFGSTGFDHVPISRACIASMAVPPFFSPVRIGGRHYIDSGAAQIGHLDAAVSEGADVIVVVNPMVPVLAERVPTGHGPKSSVRNKGLMWVMNQSIRIGMHHFMRDALSRIALTGETDVLLIEPDPSDAILFMHNPASFAARRKILEYAYRTTRKVVEGWFAEGMPALARAGLRPQEGAT